MHSLPPHLRKHTPPLLFCENAGGFAVFFSLYSPAARLMLQCHFPACLPLSCSWFHVVLALQALTLTALDPSHAIVYQLLGLSRLSPSSPPLFPYPLSSGLAVSLLFVMLIFRLMILSIYFLFTFFSLSMVVVVFFFASCRLAGTMILFLVFPVPCFLSPLYDILMCSTDKGLIWAAAKIGHHYNERDPWSARHSSLSIGFSYFHGASTASSQLVCPSPYIPHPSTLAFRL